MANPNQYLLAAVILVCLGFLPILVLFSSMFHLSHGNLRLARFHCVAALAGAGLQWLAVFVGSRYLVVTTAPAAASQDAFGWILRLPLPLLAMVGFAVVTTLGSVLLNAHIEKEERRRKENGGDGPG